MINLSCEDKRFVEETWQKLKAKLEVTTIKSRQKIPYTTVKGVHDDMSIDQISRWTNGFWGGLMWLMYSQTKNEDYKATAKISEQKLNKALEHLEYLNHDVGFMFHILHGADYRLTGSEEAKSKNFLAAQILLSRYEEKGGFIRSWNGTWRGEDTNGWTIIDSMMNLNLLYWASEVSGNDTFKQVAITHADTVMKNHVRLDGSINHIVVNDPNSFRVMLDSKGGQGYAKGSCWSRGLGWAVYGFVLSYIHTGKKEYLETAIKCANYFIKEVKKTGYIPLCDFNQPKTPAYYDSTAGAVVACGLIEIGKILGNDGIEYLETAISVLKALEEKCCNFGLEEDGILQMGTECYGKGIHIPIIYGDYYFTEAIIKLKGNNFLPW
ncbi:MAG: glycoside hydrolase family 88 protein [Clostridia bacterium]|nr:glycoside hydrolase family 88 protein [Clostridia bacterium]